LSALFDNPIFEFNTKYKMGKNRFVAERTKRFKKIQKAKYEAKLAEKKGDGGR